MDNESMHMIDRELNDWHEVEANLEDKWEQGYLTGYRAAINALFSNYMEQIKDLEDGVE